MRSTLFLSIWVSGEWRLLSGVRPKPVQSPVASARDGTAATAERDSDEERNP